MFRLCLDFKIWTKSEQPMFILCLDFKIWTKSEQFMFRLSLDLRNWPNSEQFMFNLCSEFRIWPKSEQFMFILCSDFKKSDLFSRVLFSFLPPLLVTPLPTLLSAPFSPFSPLKNGLFGRARGTAQSLERGSFRRDLSTNFGKEIPSRNPREKGSEMDKI